jgi:hypothetical protein
LVRVGAEREGKQEDRCEYTALLRQPVTHKAARFLVRGPLRGKLMLRCLQTERLDARLVRMRTTLTLDEHIAKALKSIAHQSGKPFEQVVNETLQAGLALKATRKPRPYRLKPVSMGGVLPGVELTKALSIATALEDEEIVRKVQLRK